jgi:hypothetical protein
VNHLIAALIVALTLTACGGGGSDSPTPAEGGGDTPAAATAPSIVTQPAAQSVTAPAPATFSVTATGSPALNYQWRSSSNGTDWTDISGATGASYDTGGTDPGMNGRYYAVVVSNSAGSVTSGSAQLSVQASGGGTGPSGEFPHAANPLAVTVTPADAALASFFIGSSADATVQSPAEATGIAVADGVTVSLGLPGNTLLEDQSLAVTPVTLTGLDAAHPLPFQSVLGAFRLAPADTNIPELQATNLVRITFALSQAALDALGGRPVIFSARTDGTQLHLVPVSKNPDGTWSALTLTTRVGHLGVFGVASVSDAQATALAAAWPSFDDFQLEAAMAPASYEWRKATLAAQTGALAVRARPLGRVNAAASGETDWEAQFRARLDAYYNDEVVPALNAANAANADIAQFQDASLKIFTWERQRQLFGLQDERDADLSQRLLDLLKRGLDKAMAACSTEHTAAAAAQTLGMARQLALLGVESNITLQSILDGCGRSTYDVSVTWTQVHSWDASLKFDDIPANAFTGRQQQNIQTSGNLHLADPNPDVTGVTIDLSASTQRVCAAGAYLCTSASDSTTAHDTAPTVGQCGSGFFGSYSVERWNLDARGHYTGPVLNLRFVNSFGCGGSSFNVPTRATQTNYDANGNVSSTKTVGTGDSVDTTTWNGSLSLGSSSRIVRRSVAITGQAIEPGAIERWTTSLTFKVTEVQPGK